MSVFLIQPERNAMLSVRVYPSSEGDSVILLQGEKISDETPEHRMLPGSYKVFSKDDPTAIGNQVIEYLKTRYKEKR